MTVKFFSTSCGCGVNDDPPPAVAIKAQFETVTCPVCSQTIVTTIKEKPE